MVSTEPNHTPVAPLKSEPVIVTEVPPAAGPLSGVMELTTGAPDDPPEPPKGHPGITHAPSKTDSIGNVANAPALWRRFLILPPLLTAAYPRRRPFEAMLARCVSYVTFCTRFAAWSAPYGVLLVALVPPGCAPGAAWLGSALGELPEMPERSCSAASKGSARPSTTDRTRSS